MLRRALLLATPALLLAPRARAWAPDRPLTLMVPNGAGGTTDIAARILAEALAPLLGQPVVVENRPGANGVLAAQAVLRAPADGHTLLLAYSGYLTGTPAIIPDLPYQPLRDLAAVAPVMDTPHAVMVHPAVPATTLAELAGFARANPGLEYASTGTGSVQHLGTELWRQMADVPALTNVPYRAVGPAIADLLAGRVRLFITTIPPVAGFLRDGRLRALALTDIKRSPTLPELPTAAEAGMPGLDVVTWNAVFAGRGTPAPVLARLGEAVQQALAQPHVRQRMADQGATPGSGDAAALTARLARELAQSIEVVRRGDIKPD
jgi:tripartite-type tricarboxylate transporter receptor subunit TctC